MSDSRVCPDPSSFDDDEPAVTILHLSDIQFGRHHRFADPGGGFDTLLRRLCDDLDLLARENGLEPDLVALTGDLSEWGMKAEFEQVADFGEGLLAHLDLDPDRLLVIPGNHDINRKLCGAYFWHCEGNAEIPRRPYWPKWEPYVGLLSRLYRDVDRYRFTRREPWTLFEISSLKVVVAGLNSTIDESHRDEDHHGFLGEEQLRWFAEKLSEYETSGWLRVGMVHHNPVRGAVMDDENLKDSDDLKEILGDRLHVLLHGHTHRGRIEMLGPSLPVVSAGSAAVKRDQRPGPSPDQAGETPNQYQLVRFTRGGLWCAAREYSYARKRWIGDNRVSKYGDCWWYSVDRVWTQADATFPATPGARSRTTAEEIAAEQEESGVAGLRVVRRSDDDLLDDVIGWCRIQTEGRLVEVTRVCHRGPWGDYAKVHDRDRGIGLLGAYRGELTAEVLERWVADVHDPFQGRGQPVSRLVIGATEIDPVLRSAAQARGVDVERMIDYQRILDTIGYSQKLRERLGRDREYPSEFYVEQRLTGWNPTYMSAERIDRAADWLALRLLEREGAFVLVLGQAGVGKTFLLREVARRLSRQQAITPILVELRDLERAHSIEELVAMQFTRVGVPWHPRAFRRDLEEGRLALLFDGFDELALRVRSAAIPAHFERIHAAAIERARIVVTSRTEHFLSSGQVAELMTPSSASTTPLGGMLERVQRRHVLEVHPFDRDDVRVYLRKRLGNNAGETRFARLARVHDLVGLACNPRMLGFLVDIPDSQLAQAAGLGESITSDALYRIVVDDAWLTKEAERLRPPGSAPGPDAAALRDAATNLALQLWRDPGGSIPTEEVGIHAGGLLARMCDNDADWTTHTARARTLLIRDERDQIGFIHQTVLEWLVACRLAGEITGEVAGNHLEVGRLNVFMIEILRERVGDEVLVRWAERILASHAAGAAAENARDVLKRLDRQASAQAIHRDQDLRGQDLAGQSLRHSIFDRADLTGARLVNRDLTGASLVGAQLVYADFTDACLRGADLTGADLAFARFHRADLQGARLAGARLTGVSFLGARGMPALEDARAIGIAPAVTSSIDAMYGRLMWGGCRVAMSPDGAVLATGHDDGTVYLWDCTRGQPIRILHKHRGSVLSVAFSPDGKTIASAGDDVVQLWNLDDGGQRVRLAEHGGGARSVVFSPDGEIVATGGDDVVRLSNVADGMERRQLIARGGAVLSVALSPDGKIVVSGSDDGLVRLWDVEDGRERAQLVAHRGRVRSVAFSPDGKVLASGGDDMVRLWNVEDGSERARLDHGGSVWSVAFSPDGKLLASGGDDGAVQLWNAGTGSERTRLGGHGERISGVVFSPDGKTLVSGGDGAVRLWNVGDGSERAKLARHGGSIWSLAFSPDGGALASGGDGTLRLWSARDGSERTRLIGHRGSAWAVAFSPDGKTVASGGDDAVVRVWAAADGAERTRLVGHRGRVLRVTFSPDGTMIASAGDDGTLRLWNAATGDEMGRLAGHRRRVWTVTFSPDGAIVASGGDDGTVRLWNTADRSERTRLSRHRGNVWSVGFSPDGATMASAGDDAMVRLWNMRDGNERELSARAGGSVFCVAFSPDGAMVASGSDDATVRLWNMADGSERALLAGHGGSVFCVAFSPDGAMVASGAADGTVRLWDIATIRCLAVFYGTASGVVVARPDGRYRVRGDIAGQFWHVIGLHRYDIGELDVLLPGLRLLDDEPLYPSNEWSPRLCLGDMRE
ncbi:MAG TPA: pentapeptide repeat-containing protein [Kofleriaceae bacterium]